MTVWCGPDISPCFEIVYDAIKPMEAPNVSAARTGLSPIRKKEE